MVWLGFFGVSWGWTVCRVSRSWDDAGFLWFCGCLVGAPVWCVRDLFGFLGAGLIVEYFGFGFCPRCCYFT